MQDLILTCAKNMMNVSCCDPCLLFQVAVSSLKLWLSVLCIHAIIWFPSSDRNVVVVDARHKFFSLGRIHNVDFWCFFLSTSMISLCPSLSQGSSLFQVSQDHLVPVHRQRVWIWYVFRIRFCHDVYISCQCLNDVLKIFKSCFDLCHSQ